MILDYETLRVIWWVLLGLLLIGIAVMDGFDFGVGILLHRVARTDLERRVTLNTIGPVWEGNQVWLILGGGAIFAAWPALYAVAFSGFYFAMLLVLIGLILRPIGFKYRAKVNNQRWRQYWDIALFLGGFLPALLFGVALGNVLQGVPFYFDESLRMFYTGTLFGLLNPFALLCGLVSVAMLTMHGGVYLTNKTNDIIQQRAKHYAIGAAVALIILFAAAGVWVAHGINGFVVTNMLNHDAPSNPLYKQVALSAGAWINNYAFHPVFIFAPVLGFIGAILTILFLSMRCFKLAWIMSAISIAGVVATVGVSMFPFLLPSSIHPNMSLLVWDASSSHLTLFIMLIATVIFLPIILLYTSWVYRVLRGKVTAAYIEENKHSVY